MTLALAASLVLNLIAMAAVLHLRRSNVRLRRDCLATSKVVEELTKSMERKLGNKKAGRVIYGMIQNVRNQRTAEQVGAAAGGAR